MTPIGLPRPATVPPRVDPDDAALMDRLTQEIRPDDAMLSPWFTSYCREHLTRLATDLAIVRQRIADRARLLEYGSTPPLLTAALAERGYAVSGLDIAPERFGVAIRDRGLDVARCDVETDPVPFDDEVFDAVLFNELFEHLRLNPIFTMREVRRVLKPGGTLLLSTPNLRSFRGLRNLLLHHHGHTASGDVYRQFEKLETLGHMGHVREYTSREVVAFLDQVGFSSHAVIFRGGHGRGIVGMAERLLPSFRPAFTLIARREEAAANA